MVTVAAVCTSASEACLSLLALTFDGDVSDQALFLPVAPALRLAHIITLVVQLDGVNGEVQHPAVGGVLEGELAFKRRRVAVQVLAVQLLSAALLVMQGLRVEAVPPQLLVCVIISAAAHRHLLLLLWILRGQNIYAEALRDGFEDERGTGRECDNIN